MYGNVALVSQSTVPLLRAQQVGASLTPDAVEMELDGWDSDLPLMGGEKCRLIPEEAFGRGETCGRAGH